MSSIPLLDNNQDEIRESLSIEEIRIALTFLKKRFRDYTLKEIIHALSDYLAQKQFSSMSIPINRGANLGMSRVPEGLFIHHRHQPLCHDDRSKKSEEIRLVAKLYCQSGINFSLAQFFYPQMTAKDYKSVLELIAAQTVNCIEKFLRYQCNVQIEQLSHIQKRSLRQKLINIREWMGKTNPENLKTYFLFIERYYLNQSIEIEYKEALELYKIILKGVKGPEVELTREGQPQTNRGLRQELSLTENNQKSCTKEQEYALIMLFKQLCSVEKVSDAMCQKYGYDIKWSIHSVKNILKRIYKASLKKLAETANSYLKKPLHLWFGYGDEDVNTLLQYENSMEIKILLLDFYLLKKTTELKLKQFLKKVNQFYVRNYQQINVMDAIPEENLPLPTLVIQENPIQMIQITDQPQNTVKKQHVRIHTFQKPRISKSQKKPQNWKEVIQLQYSSSSYQIEIIPTNLVQKEKDPQQTDIEDKFFQKNTNQKNNPDPLNEEAKKCLKQFKPSNYIKDLKEIQNSQVKQQFEHNQNQQKNEKLTRDQLLKILKTTKLNTSIDSIESEPVPLNHKIKSADQKSGRFGSIFNNRFKKKKTQKNQKEQNQMQLEN